MITCPLNEIGFGGARGGGKTDGVLGKFGLKADTYGRHFNAVFFRREMPQQDDLIERAKEIYLKVKAQWHEQKKLFVFPKGGRVRFRPLESIQDAEKYQGQNLTDAAIEEAGNYPDPAPIDRLFGCLRSVGGVPIQLITTFNPGGPGHGWLKKRYLPPEAKLGMKLLERDLPNGKKHQYIYIPSRVQNNAILLKQDPGYIDRLHLVGSPQLVKAWLEGDFEIHEGTYFPEFGTRHIVQPFPIPKHWKNKYLGFDWGYHSPYCALWGVVSSGKDDNGNEVRFPKGSIIIYRELTGKGHDNTDIAKRINELSEGEDILMVADPSIFNTQGGPSISDQFRAGGIAFRPADNERITGWNEIRRRLKPDPAYLYITENCQYLLDSLPGLPMDPRHPEDVDTDADDHAADALRYLCKARTFQTDYAPPKENAKMHGRVLVSDYIQQVRRDRDRPRV